MTDHLQPRASDIGLFETDAAGRLTTVDEAFRRIILRGQPVPLGKAPWANAQPDVRMIAERQWAQQSRFSAGTSNSSFDITVPLPLPEGGSFIVRFVAQPVVDSRETLLGYRGVALIAPDEARGLEREHQELLTLLDASDDVLVVTTHEGAVLYINNAGNRFPALIESVRDQVPRQLLEVAEGRWRGEVALRAADGDMHTLDVQVTRNAEHMTLLARDITSTVRLQAQLTHLATHDSLTGLPNRTLFLRKLSEAIERSRATQSNVAVFFVDIDRLKDVNDTIGHDSGDVLISNIGRRLVAATRPGDVIGRIGGDEFAVMCEGLSDEMATMELAERVRRAITGQMTIQGIEIRSGASIGVALTTANQVGSSLIEAAESLMRDADTAMYQAKMRGRSRCALFTERMRESARERALLSSSLESAIARHELTTVYQPILDAHSNRIVAVESLLRWQHPKLGLLTPSSFIDLAEESGAIAPIGDWVIGQACQDLRLWLDEERIDRHFIVHINISRRQVNDQRFVERLLTAIESHQVSPAQLALEFDEKMLLNDDGSILRTLLSVKRLGFGLAIDDFGSSYSSLSHLRSCPVDFLKLDGSFVRELGQDERGDPIVRSMIQLAHSLDITVVAEWVTTNTQLERLRVLGCDRVQGFGIARPVHAADVFTSVASATNDHSTGDRLLDE